MSNQVGDCFKYFWPFQNVRTLSKYLNSASNIFQFELEKRKEENYNRLYKHGTT